MLKKMRKNVALLLSAVLLLGYLTGCSGTKPANPAETPGASTPAATREIVDMQGNTVTIPTEVNKIAVTSWKGAFGSLILLGQLDKVAVMADVARYTWLNQAFPQIKDIPNYGSFNDVNVEELLDANLDIIISPEQAADANKKMQDLKMPVYVDGITPADDKSVLAVAQAEINAMADVTGTKDVADAYYKWQNDLLAEIEKRVATIPEGERKTALVVRTTMDEVFCENISLGYGVILAGGKLATEGINQYYTKVDPEEIVKWNPDFIFQQIVTSPYGEEMAQFYNNWKKDERYKNLTAVKNGDCYIMPMGIVQWSGDIEFAQGVLLMAKMMYPEVFADMDVKKYAEEFYQKFLGYTMTDADWKVMAPNFAGAKTTGLSQ
ncbi:ABC transporter substrate-binding protein [Desulfitobacterium chlororespirans]|uniref:Iron complex transport system substrate-binding protein n=1 Tax=Desulfitobacterium chlororespirans DSM 11544 TaxID=1121395 RepID=A0A1M7TAZ2_9FIRM|nr:ABC transporter substrate-binding protein [Desulfitobacterium chlororespirans]SHN67873.1 iron complex transport system substrate-binding protein [Desulfitobacterium chlororespirans DSM 11544]